MGVEQRGNEVLGTLLAELGWSPSRLADAVNGLLSPGYVARSTVSEWLHQDRVPRHPLPTVVAHLISDALDREVPVEQLWSGRAQPAEFWVPADAGLRLPWTAEGTVDVLDDWLRHTGGAIGMDRRIFFPVSGSALTAPAWGYVDHLGAAGTGSFAALADERRSITVTSGMVDAVAAATAGIRNLGDAEGGNEDNLRFVHHHLTWVAKLLRQARFPKDTVAHRLLTEWAQLAQLAGWMAHDAGQHGLSQRYFSSGLHAAHTAGDRSVGVYLLACASQNRVHQGRLADGIDLGRAARDAVELANAAHEVARSTPATVRALAASRFALAQAAVSNARGFHAAADEARALLHTPGALEGRPPYLTWFGSAELEDQLAQGALTLAAVTSRDSRALLDGAEKILGRTATDPASTTPRRRVPRGMARPSARRSRRPGPSGTRRTYRAAPTAHRPLSPLRVAATPAGSRPHRPAPTSRPAPVRSLHDHLRAT